MNSYITELSPTPKDAAPSEERDAPVHRSRSVKQARQPGELIVRRLRVTTTDHRGRAVGVPSEEQFCHRVDTLLYRGPPCWKSPACTLRAGHEQGCTLAGTRKLTREDFAAEDLEDAELPDELEDDNDDAE